MPDFPAKRSAKRVRRIGNAATLLRQMVQFIMPGLVSGIYAFKTAVRKRRGWPEEVWP
jgi:hypothetical protein